MYKPGMPVEWVNTMSPNWTVNRLTITGPANERARFKDQATKYNNPSLDHEDELKYAKLSDKEASAAKLADALQVEEMPPVALTFTAFKPMPKDAGDWYNWNCANWGTKWDASDATVRETNSSLVYDFETAWSPPCPAVAEMSEQFPQLKFNLRFWERGMGFQGNFVLKDGKVLKDVCTNDYRGNKGG